MTNLTQKLWKQFFGAGVRVVTLGKFLWRVVEGRVTFEQEEKLLPVVGSGIK